jgi:hypothetical protein
MALGAVPCSAFWQVARNWARPAAMAGGDLGVATVRSPRPPCSVRAGRWSGHPTHWRWVSGLRARRRVGDRGEPDDLAAAVDVGRLAGAGAGDVEPDIAAAVQQEPGGRAAGPGGLSGAGAQPGSPMGVRSPIGVGGEAPAVATVRAASTAAPATAKRSRRRVRGWMPCWSPLRCWVDFPAVRTSGAAGAVRNAPAGRVGQAPAASR